eukprot:CAMPEP_0172092814 /NCGR_PEP_ID=MMETSP1043-20130122/25638_1 /TAXON_ID=464988 /ORGANISM="Hemiselmis andersenii, Strain CCMP441" /LENGTH=260 /DNA_ID=CAMNT_0012755551 /DNA_START=385 /DNA_END=1164 /DNA_ORIENTATION=+
MEGKPVAVIGASRGTGLQCVLALARKKIPCRAVARDVSACQSAVFAALQAPLRKYVVFHKADVTEPGTLLSAVQGCQGVINCATASAWWRLPFQEDINTPPHVDYHGAVAVAGACAAAKVPRYVMVSSAAVNRPQDWFHMQRNALCGRIMDWKLLGEQGTVKVLDAVSSSSASQPLSLTIVRPGALTDKSLSGSLPRADLASICVEAVFNQDAKGLVFEVVSGKQGGNYPTCSNFEQVFTSLRHGHLPVTSTSCLQGGLG